MAAFEAPVVDLSDETANIGITRNGSRAGRKRKTEANGDEDEGRKAKAPTHAGKDADGADDKVVVVLDADANNPAMHLMELRKDLLQWEDQAVTDICSWIPNQTDEVLTLIIRAVRKYGADHPDEEDPQVITNDVFGLLMESVEFQRESERANGKTTAGAAGAAVGNISRHGSKAKSSAPAKVYTPLESVLDVFPDADHAGVTKLLKQYNDNIEMTIQHMAESGYEKRAKKAEAVAKVEKDFSSSSWETSAHYRTEALLLLQSEFPFIRVNSFRELFLECKSHYWHTLQKLESDLKVTAGQINYANGGFNAVRHAEVAEAMKKAGILSKTVTKSR